MMMRHRKQWTYVGMLAKVAGRNSVITNIGRGGGYVQTVPEALRAPGKRLYASKVSSRLRELSYSICRRFNRYKYTRQIGIDYGIDHTGKIWVIEVNFDYPSHALFAKLSNRSMYHKIKKIASTWKKKPKH